MKRKAFRLCRILRVMPHPHASTAEILALIRELTVADALPAGAEIRRALQARFGRRGGMARVYRILADERRRRVPVQAPDSLEDLQRELQAMRERAERAEERERAHQSHWGMEIDRLRLRLQALEPLAARRGDRDPTELLRQQLRAAEQRAAGLEEQLLVVLARSGSADSDPDIKEGSARKRHETVL